MHRLLSACALAAALAFGGCGGDDADQGYVEDVNAAQARLTQSFANLQTRISNVSEPARDARVLAEYEAAVDKAVTDLRAIDPPGDVEQLHADLMRETSSYTKVIAEARRSLASEDAATIVKAQVDLTTGITQITSRINETASKINRALKE